MPRQRNITCTMHPLAVSRMLQDAPLQLSFGCADVDANIGKLRTSSGITEISGEAGSGKSQICMKLSLTVASM